MTFPSGSVIEVGRPRSSSVHEVVSFPVVTSAPPRPSPYSDGHVAGRQGARVHLDVLDLPVERVGEGPVVLRRADHQRPV